MASRPATIADSCWTQENVASLGNASRRRADTLFQSHQAKIDVMLCLAVVWLAALLGQSIRVARDSPRLVAVV
jgi:hypothetical protein